MSNSTHTTNLNTTKMYKIKKQVKEGGDCSLYYLPEVGEYCDQKPGWQFYCGFNPNHNPGDMNWDDLPEWMQIAFLNSPNLEITDWKAGDDF